MPWQILIAFNVAAFAGLSLAMRWALRDGKFSPVIFSIVNVFYAAILYSLVGAALGYELVISDIPAWNVLLGGIMNVGIFLFVARATSQLEVGPYSMLLNLKGVMTIALSIIILDEPLSVWLIVGSILILIAASMVSYRKGQKLRAGSGEAYALLAGAAIAVAFVNDIYVIDTHEIDLALFLTIEHIIAGTGLMLIYHKSLGDMKRHIINRDFWLKVSLPTFFVVFGLFSVFEAFKQDVDASLLSAIAQTTSVVAVIASIFLLGEKDRLKLKISAAILSTIGLIILSV